MWNDAVNLFETYMGSGIIVGWFVVSLLYLGVKEKDPARRTLFVYFPIIVLFLYFNPLFVKVVYGIVGEEIYYRFLWIIPMSMTIAYSAVRIYENVRDSLKGWYLGCVVVMILISGKFIYSNEHFSVAENMYHIPETVIKICDTIHVEGREVTAAFPQEMIQYVRQYDSTICMPYGREALVSRWGGGNELYDILLRKEIDVEQLVYWSKDGPNGGIYPCNYIIVSEDTVFIGDLESHGIVLYDSIDGYNIYHDTTFYIGL